MSAREQKLEELFEQLRAVPPRARDAYLQRLCPHDALMREEVSQLLAASERPHELLDRPPFRRPDLDEENEDAEVHRLTKHWVGRTIGRYTITAFLGRGGTGIVYAAQQARPRREVALKLMRSSMMTESLIRRFMAEADMLAELQHPAIAQVYDADVLHDGTSEIPYFVMEYIRHARPITDFAQEQSLSKCERIAMFIHVCDAVHHAHQHGIVHRDIKPANILIDEDGRVKVIDFGIARVTKSDITLPTLHTSTNQVLGTLRYMSPEQCEGRGREVDIRSDVYSLTVVLYEMLTGELPYVDSLDTVVDATRTIVCEEPRPPSAIDQRLRGDLETIVLKGLEKEPAQRYQSARDLAEDLQRYLDGKPILARPPSRWQRFSRWISRHPIATTTLACLTIASMVVALTFASVWYLGLRPHEVVVAPKGNKVELRSAAGHTLHTWRAAGITYAEMVDVPTEFGGGQFVLIGYNHNQANPHPGAICAYDVQQRSDEPVWIGRLQTDDLPQRLHKRGFHHDEFRVNMATLLHVFPDLPGPQIVVNHRHVPYSQGAIRIYDLAGNVLYQTWHDGEVRDAYWMDEAGLLVFAGLNGLVYWEEREYHADEQWPADSTDHRPHPHVIFAVRPEVGLKGTKWICPDLDGENFMRPAWYRCLLPPASGRYFSAGRTKQLTTPFRALSQGRYVRWTMRSTDDDPRAIHFVLDARGTEIRDARVVNDHYRRDADVPPADIFHVDELPPLRIENVSEICVGLD